MGSGLGASLVDEGPPRERPGPAATDGLALVGSGGAGSSFAMSAGLAVFDGSLAVFDFVPLRDAQETRAKPRVKARSRERMLRMMEQTRLDGRAVRNEIRPHGGTAPAVRRRAAQPPPPPSGAPARGAP